LAVIITLMNKRMTVFKMSFKQFIIILSFWAAFGIAGCTSHNKDNTPTAQTTLNKVETVEKQTEEPWGMMVGGLQCRLRPLKYKWQFGQTPLLYLDLKNQGKHEFDYIDNVWAYCEIEVDGNWYGYTEKYQRIEGHLEILYPGFEQDGMFTIFLGRGSEFWGEHFKLGSGKHVVIVRFNKGWPVSNAVELEVLPEEKSTMN
jgi:hypothetical protein